MTALVWQIPLVAVVGYLLGNFQTGIVVSRAIGKFDVRTKGSNNAGTTNVLRTMGWLPSVLTLLGDVLKGFTASMFGFWLLGIWGIRLGGLCAILGHNWPALFKFKGGKGIATSLGVVLSFDPWIGLALVACQSITLAITHTMSIASMASASLLFALTLIFRFGQWDYVIFAAIVTALALFSHRTNMVRLHRKNENKLDFRQILALSKKKGGGDKG